MAGTQPRSAAGGDVVAPTPVESEFKVLALLGHRLLWSELIFSVLGVWHWRLLRTSSCSAEVDSSGAASLASRGRRSRA